MAIEQFFSLLQSADASGSRSTALKPLGWLTAIVAGVLILLGRQNAFPLLIPYVLGLFALIVLAYLSSYFYFMLKNPDALRSETFNLRKLQLQQSRTGDNDTGFIESGVYSESDSDKLLPNRVVSNE